MDITYYSHWAETGWPTWAWAGTAAAIDVSYATPQVHKIVNVTLHWEYSSGIVFIFTQGRISIMSKPNTESNSNEYY
jgi:hypothetical protein